MSKKRPQPISFRVLFFVDRQGLPRTTVTVEETGERWSTLEREKRTQEHRFERKRWVDGLPVGPLKQLMMAWSAFCVSTMSYVAHQPWEEEEER